MSKKKILFKDIRDLIAYDVWECGYYIADKNGHSICQVFGGYTTFRNKKVCNYLENNFEHDIISNAKVLELGDDYCILDIEIPFMEGNYEAYEV